VAPWHGSRGIRIDVSSGEPVEGITFEFQRNIASVDAGANLLADHRRIVLPALKSAERLSVHVSYSR
jgi:hypothetical protein